MILFIWLCQSQLLVYVIDLISQATQCLSEDMIFCIWCWKGVKVFRFNLQESFLRMISLLQPVLASKWCLIAYVLFFKSCFFSYKEHEDETDKTQRAKKVVFDSPGLVDFAIGLVNSVFNVPNGQVIFFEEFKYQKNCEINSACQKAFGVSWNDVRASKC